MPTPEQEVDAAILELERAVQEQVRLWDRPMNLIGWDQADAIQHGVESARTALRRLFAERSALPRSISEALNSGDGTYRP